MKKDIIITIFGSTGDLTARKLLPAISKLYQSKSISQNMLVIALGRRPYDTNSYLNAMQSLTKEPLNLDVLSKIVHYYPIQITSYEEYKNLSEFISGYKTTYTKELYYLAIGPDILAEVASHISKSGLIQQNNLNQVLVFEKPFGHDLDSARAINRMLWKYFDESQIYRIDHYLGKEMIQNLMTVRFANRIFEESWDNQSIESVKIVVKEKEGILNRAGYYDKSGALKDMVQSHLLQILSLIAMDIPKAYESQYITDEKVKVLNALTFDEKSVIMGQYEGYLNEPNIPGDSKTETFVYLKAFVNTKRFKGVPFEIMTGKKMDKKDSYIEITYLPTKEQEKWKLPVLQNKLVIRIQPNDGVGLTINSKKPGLKNNLELVELNYQLPKSVEGNIPEAYEKLFLDVINGSKTLFTRWDEIESSWKFIDLVKEKSQELTIYKNETEIINYIMKKKAL